jgi:site-specific DNA-adenine methylase
MTRKKTKDILNILPSYVGSKKYWIKYLSKYKGLSFIEPFCGSSVISFNLANTAILNDIDAYIFKIINEFDKQIVPEEFSYHDYFEKRKIDDWYKYAYCFQAMSFSGVFRYSKNGYNVPIKPKWRNIPLRIRDDYLIDLKRWKDLAPKVMNLSYNDIPLEEFKDKVVILDPPYENSKASYNNNTFNYKNYWEWLYLIKDICKTMIVFDSVDNLNKQNIPIFKVRSMSVNGKYKSSKEGLSIYENGNWIINE